MEEYCSICGAKLINSPDGLGSSCRALVQKYTYVHMKENSDRAYYYKYWNIEADIYMKYFKECTKNVNFKSNFRKNFVPSVISFYDTKGYISKKQLGIIKDMMTYDYRMELAERDVKEIKKSIFEEYQNLHYSEIVGMVRELYKGGKL